LYFFAKAIYYLNNCALLCIFVLMKGETRKIKITIIDDDKDRINTLLLTSKARIFKGDEDRRASVDEYIENLEKYSSGDSDS